jgi:hypothetical protein
MEVRPVIDGNHIYIGKDGQPLRNGRLFFYDESTNAPKSVYTDIERTTPASNPVTLNGDGRAENQLFMGEGLYSVEAFAFNGVDPVVEPDDSWSFDHSWILDGVATVVQSAEVITVETIADLRAVDQDLYSFVRVLGYYEAGDMFIRTYALKTNADADNGGTIVKSPSISGKSWLHAPVAGVVDGRVFGIFKDTVESNNSKLVIASLWCQANGCTLHITKGVYTFEAGTVGVYCDISIDDGFSILNNGISPTIIQINKGLDCRMTGSLKNSGGSEDAYFSFTDSAKVESVNVRWFGCKCDNSTDDSVNFEKCCSSVHAGNIDDTFITIDANLLLGDESNVSVYSNLRFERYGRLISTMTTKSTNINSKKIEHKNLHGLYGMYPCFDATRFNRVGWSGSAPIRASYFNNVSNYETQDLSLVFNNLTVSTGTNVCFIFDNDVNKFSTELSISKTINIVFKYEHGKIFNSAAVSVRLSCLDAPIQQDVFSTMSYPVIIENGVQHLTWWKSYNENYRAWFNALTSCFLGSGILDCDGESATKDNINQFIDDTYIGDGSNAYNVHIYNGSCLIPTDNIYAIAVHDLTMTTLKLEGIKCPNSVGNGLLKLRNATASLVYIDECLLFSDYAEPTGLILVEGSSGGGISNLVIENSYVQATELLYVTEAGYVSDIILNNNTNLACSTNSLKTIANKCTGNTFIGSSGSNVGIGITSKTVAFTGNKLAGCSLYLTPDSNNKISAFVNDNHFETANSIDSTVVIFGSSNSSIAGVFIQNNLFSGNSSSPVELIQFSGTFADEDPFLVVHDNNAINTNNILRSTKVIVPFNVVTTATSHTIDVTRTALLYPSSVATIRVSSFYLICNTEHHTAVVAELMLRSPDEIVIAFDSAITINASRFTALIGICGER